MIDSALLLSDLKRVLKSLEADLKVRAEDSSTDWGRRLRDEYDRAKAKERTGLAWIDWRDGEVSQAAVAWIIATVFIRFAEDNGLLAGAELDGRRVSLPWIAAPSDGLERAVENETAFYAASPTMTSRDWLHQAFRTLAALPAGKPLVDPDHSPVWHAPISATASDALLEFFRRTTPDGALVHDFSDPELGTRFLGDLYQDLSEYAKKTYALLQTPVFVEEFILDLTLTPAIAEFGLTGLKLIDPTCGSGHFLLGAFERLVASWAEAAPAEDRRARVQKALDSIHGVDLNPFAIAISRFRLTVAALRASGLKSLVEAPAFHYHLAIGDSLLGSVNPNAGLELGDDEYFEYDAEDLTEYADILKSGQYHVVVGNPPYIQPPDAKLRDTYRALYPTCHRKYALTVPFMELLFRLAKRPNGGSAGYVGQITSNSFMKREFGKKLIEQFLSGNFTGMSPDYVDLTHIIDTSGAYIPGHGTPTVILAGRPRKPQLDTVVAVLGVRGEPQQPSDPADGLVWRDIVDHVDRQGYEGPYVTISDVPRSTFASFPWSLSGGGAGDLKERLEEDRRQLGNVVESMGFGAITGLDDFHVRDALTGSAAWESVPTLPYVEGEAVRDWGIQRHRVVLNPYGPGMPRSESATYWPYRHSLDAVLYFGATPTMRGQWWGEFAFANPGRLSSTRLIALAFVATHNHFVLTHQQAVLNKSAPVIKLPEGATEDDHYDLLGVLNSSVACFWLKQVSHNKGGPGGGSSKDEKWRDFYEFTATKLEHFPLPDASLGAYAQRLDQLANESALLLKHALGSSERLGTALQVAGERWVEIRREMIAVQEELDWATYRVYGLTDLEPLDPAEITFSLGVGERPVEIALARQVKSGQISTRWFDEFAEIVTTEVPDFEDAEYRQLVNRRLVEIETNAQVRLLETPDFKRKWETIGWARMVSAATHQALLDRLEAPELWRDGRGVPLVRSAAQVADDLRRDDAFRELLTIHLGTQDYDLTHEVGKLLAGEAVPGLAALRYKASGIEKFRAWEHTWELQRAEDRGERVDIAVPPKYVKGDFLKDSYWTARGKLDVPKERFISYPGSRLREDTTELYGWTGWDHAERGQAVARLANELSRAAASDEQIIPLVGVLLELEPWLKQWHDEIDARSGVSPATAIAGATTTLLARLGVGRDQVAAWRPPASKRGRRSAS
ncbi:BREX-2 system adenine-specific DNA-methyltransferase PglX [Microbacterium sp. nov. GSS16]|uniref:BREX-2 system adenine-specific DNA-methyltransferase PglX n=1 Tax=Microbacterium sp. nov. GSS16 TaxID=3019890 RepID=UPI0023063FEC|nr:BREX-2 system adenine-specific DNA-methyltransferase PglX [Microbacterium sp. nov. GSS16]WCD92319.1 BREX-2 system adenine-specific DNA-methyltransferase PglX [Microbacterium sp. nov. GSS16]